MRRPYSQPGPNACGRTFRGGPALVLVGAIAILGVALPSAASAQSPSYGRSRSADNAQRHAGGTKAKRLGMFGGDGTPMLHKVGRGAAWAFKKLPGGARTAAAMARVREKFRPKNFITALAWGAFTGVLGMAIAPLTTNLREKTVQALVEFVPAPMRQLKGHIMATWMKVESEKQARQEQKRQEALLTELQRHEQELTDQYQPIHDALTSASSQAEAASHDPSVARSPNTLRHIAEGTRAGLHGLNQMAKQHAQSIRDRIEEIAAAMQNAQAAGAY